MLRGLILVLVAAASVFSFPSSLSCDRHEAGWNCRR
jgi:hypothetical protein